MRSVAGPRDERGTVEGAQPLGGGKQVAAALGGAADVLGDVAAHRALGDGGPEPAVHDLARDGLSAERAIGDGQSPQGVEAEREDDRGDAAGQAHDVGQRLGGALRRDVVEGLTGTDHEARDARLVAAADEQLRATPVTHRERDLVQVQALDQLAEELGDATHREIGVGAHRLAVGAERQRRQYAAVVGAQVGDDVAPLGAVHEEAVREHDRRAGAAGVLVLDRSR